MLAVIAIIVIVVGLFGALMCFEDGDSKIGVGVLVVAMLVTIGFLKAHYDTYPKEPYMTYSPAAVKKCIPNPFGKDVCTVVKINNIEVK